MYKGFDAESVITPEVAQCLVQSRMQFAGRYYSGVDQGKVLTAAEAAVLTKSGLTIVSVYEDDGKPAGYFTAARGSQDAVTALTQARSAGQPQGSAIYFAVDFDALAADIQGGITAYFDAVATALVAKYKVGVYGSTAVCSALTAAGLVSYTWLTMSTAWGYGVKFTTPSIQQFATTSPCNVSIDGDVAGADFGGW